MGTRWPETCWATYKGEINIILKVTSSWSLYPYWTTMHGQSYIKISQNVKKENISRDPTLKTGVTGKRNPQQRALKAQKFYTFRQWPQKLNISSFLRFVSFEEENLLLVFVMTSMRPSSLYLAPVTTALTRTPRDSRILQRTACTQA